MPGREAYEKGKMFERQLGKILLNHGFFVIRSPASGRRTKKFIYPDLVAIRKGKVLLFEVKMRKKRETVYIEKRKYDNLKFAAILSGGIPYLAVYVSSDKRWYLFKLDQLVYRDRKYVLSMDRFDEGKNIEEVIKEALEEKK